MVRGKQATQSSTHQQYDRSRFLLSVSNSRSVHDDVRTYRTTTYILFVKTFVFFLKSSDCLFSCVADASIFSKFSTFINIC